MVPPLKKKLKTKNTKNKKQKRITRLKVVRYWFVYMLNHTVLLKNKKYLPVCIHVFKKQGIALSKKYSLIQVYLINILVT